MIKDLKKGYGGRTLFHDVDLLVRGGERIALIGDNGSGKTTFLNLITGHEKPDGGVIRLGPTVKTAYLEQHVHFDNMDRSAYDTVLYETGCTPQAARDRLGAFKFSGEDAFRYVSVMSGGELSRLRLCILMRDDINLLILDEPTNHLDVNSREWIEQALEDYSEALLFVSHDRYFISRFATRIWLLEDGRITDWPYSFEEFRRRRAIQTQQARPAPEKPRRAAAKSSPASAAKRAAAVEREIKAAEEKLKSIEAQVELYSADYEKLETLFGERAETEAALEALYEQWYSLTE